MYKEYGFMNEENVKIAKIKKSCHTGRIVSNILCIVFVIAFIAGVVGSIMIFAEGKEFDERIQQSEEMGYINNADRIGSARLFDINLGIVPENIESDIPAVKEALADHPRSVMWGSYMLIIGLSFAIVAVLSKIVSSIFALIEKENTPFNDKVKKRVTIAMVITTVILFLTTGTPFGILFILLTWVVRSVLEYGKTLQIESDETL